jgi:hypothetical protein
VTSDRRLSPKDTDGAVAAAGEVRDETGVRLATEAARISLAAG